MIAPNERLLRKQFISVRNSLAHEFPIVINSKLDLHSILFDLCMISMESCVLGAVQRFNELFDQEFLSDKTPDSLIALLRTASFFDTNPAVVASLFELKPESDVRKDDSISKYGDQHGARRRAGRFFTPLRIAEFMVHVLVTEYFKSNAKQDLKILDPSTGAGIFLDVIYSKLKNRKYKSRDILDSLYGVDLDSDALELSQRVLKSKSGGIYIKDTHLFKGDFLLDDLNHPDDGYNLIIGNPPYITYYSRESHIDANELKSRLLERYQKSGGGSANTFLYFLIRGIELLKDNGMLCFIVPDKLLWNKRYHKVRKYILDNAPPRAIYHAGEDVFAGATVGNVIILLEKKKQNQNKCSLSKLELNNADNTIKLVDKINVPISKFSEQKDFRFVQTDSLSEKIAENTIALKEIAHVRDGINPAYAEFRNSIISETKKTKTHKPLIEGSDISPFNLNPRKLFINYDKSLVTPEMKKRGVSLRKEWIFNSPLKLVNRQTANKLIFALDENRHCSLNSVHNTILKDDCIRKMNLEKNSVENSSSEIEFQKTILHFLLGILNSRLMNYYYRSITHETAKSFPQVHIADLNELPIKLPEFKQMVKIAHTVELILLSQSNIQIPLIALDDFIFKLYGLNRNEKDKIVKLTDPEWRI